MVPAPSSKAGLGISKPTVLCGGRLIVMLPSAFVTVWFIFQPCDWQSFERHSELFRKILTPQKFRHRFGSRPNLKLFVNPADVGVNRLVADSQFLGDLLVEKSVAQAIKYFLFAR